MKQQKTLKVSQTFRVLMCFEGVVAGKIKLLAVNPKFFI
jgi:hypothetical protein